MNDSERTWPPTPLHSVAHNLETLSQLEFSCHITIHKLTATFLCKNFISWINIKPIEIPGFFLPSLVLYASGNFAKLALDVYF